MSKRLCLWDSAGELRKGLGVVLFFLTGFAARGQSTGSVVGRVAAPAGIAVEFATVTLHRAADSVAVKTEFSDAQGAFKFVSPARGRYLVSVAQVGFVRQWTRTFELAAASINLNTITLRASSTTTLKEVTVVGQKPLFERQADRTVVNVEGSALAAGGSALDVLTRSPGVSVGANDVLALRGKRGLLVLINGKLQPLTGADLADYLRALPAEQLHSIELITNPPARYEAQGGAGIIAINLKKDQRQGTNGSVNASYGRGRYGKYTNGIALNHNQKGLNLYGNYSYSRRNGFANLDLQRDFYDQDGALSGSSAETNDIRTYARAHTWKAGLDYNLTPNTVVGAVVSGLANRISSTADSYTQLFDEVGQALQRYQTISTQQRQIPNITANVNLKHSFHADSGSTRELSADLDYGRYTPSRQLQLISHYAIPTMPWDPVLDGDQNGHLTIQTAKVDYLQTLPRQVRLETGVRASLVHSDNDVLFSNTENLTRTVNLNITNHFTYDENINAAYVSATRAYAKLTVQAGLRGEQTNAKGHQVVGNKEFSRNYFQLFPNASLKHTLTDKHELTLSVSRRIDRPTYNQLNPFRNYVNATSYRSGNPELLPQTSYNTELTHTFQQKYSTSLSYSRTENPIILAVQPSPDGTRVIVSRDLNLSTLNVYALTLTTPLTPTKWWTVYNNGVFYYKSFVGSVAGTQLPLPKVAFNVSSNSSFLLNNDWSAELSAVYQSNEQYNYEYTHAYGQVGIGVQKSLMAKKATVKLNATDLFYTSPIRATAAFNNLTESFYQRQDSRVLTLSFNYRFGNDKVLTARKRTSGAEDEKRRAGSF